jgi:hypothetical protein
MPEPMGLGQPNSDDFGSNETRTTFRATGQITWPVAISATMITLIVISGVVVMCLGCLGVFGGNEGFWK